MKRFLLSTLCAVILSLSTIPTDLAVVAGVTSPAAGYAHADAQLNCPGGKQAPDNDLSKCPATFAASSGKCGEGKVEVGVAVNGTDNCIDNNAANGGAIIVYLKYILQFLSGGVGLGVLLMMTLAGVQYITSAGDPPKIKAAKERLVNALTALILYIMAFAIISFIVPGGIL